VYSKDRGVSVPGTPSPVRLALMGRLRTIIQDLTGVEIEKVDPHGNIPLGNIPECQKYLEEGSHRRLYTFSPDDYREMSGIWGNGEVALPDDPPGELTVVDGMPEGGKIHQLTGVPSAFAPDYAPEEMFEIATKLYKASR